MVLEETGNQYREEIVYDLDLVINRKGSLGEIAEEAAKLD